MTLVACLGKVRGDVIRIGGSLIVLQMTTGAGRGREIVVVVYVAIGTLSRRHGMHSSQREGCGVVVEGSIRP